MLVKTVLRYCSLKIGSDKMKEKLVNTFNHLIEYYLGINPSLVGIEFGAVW